MKEIDFNNMLVFDFSNLYLQENSKGNCFGCDCNCDGSACDYNCDCDSNDCNDYCDNCD